MSGSVYVVASRHLRPETLVKRHGGRPVIDVTSRGPEPWVRFSPFFPHGGVPVPGSTSVTAASVEGVWQGLKVFESADIDRSKFDITSMKGLKRSVRKFGDCLGHRAALGSKELLGYVEARHAIYVPAYRWVLENRLVDEVARLREVATDAAARDEQVVLLDYETNTDIDDPTRPLSHAGLLVSFLLRG